MHSIVKVMKGDIGENYSFPTYVVAVQCARNHFRSEKYKTVQLFKLTSFKIVPICKYILLPAHVKVMETSLEAIVWKPFQLLRRIINEVSSIIKATSLQCWFQSREQVNIPAGGRQKEALMLSQYCLLRNPWPTPTCVLEHCRERKINCWFSIFREVSVWPQPKAKKGVKVHLFIYGTNSCKLYQGTGKLLNYYV
jgi:hypothetical protein